MALTNGVLKLLAQAWERGSDAPLPNSKVSDLELGTLHQQLWGYLQ